MPINTRPEPRPHLTKITRIPEITSFERKKSKPPNSQGLPLTTRFECVNIGQE